MYSKLALPRATLFLLSPPFTSREVSKSETVAEERRATVLKCATGFSTESDLVPPPVDFPLAL